VTTIARDLDHVLIIRIFAVIAAIFIIAASPTPTTIVSAFVIIIRHFSLP
jgi:hypothetical protein